MNYEKIFKKFKEPLLRGLYVTLNDIEQLLLKLNTANQLKIVGYSVLGDPIYLYEIGTGPKKIMLWSQMHGNESTTTKALFDFLNFLHGKSDLANRLLTECTFSCFPMLNPDGALLYTRENANKIDLNRDFQAFSQPESIILKNFFDDFKPDYCYNLHDQRTIFGVGEKIPKPATVSFLAPSFNYEREINTIRAKAIEVIVAMNTVLQQYIPDQVGRFDDSFNINCVGDTFQLLNCPTILIEAGHFQGDYEREITRKYIFIALIAGIKYISENDIVINKIEQYLNIPHNKICFYDIIYKNVKINYDNNKFITNFAIQFKARLSNNSLELIAYIEECGNLDGFYGHFEFDAVGADYENFESKFPVKGDEANFYLSKSIKIINGLIKS